MLDVRVGDDWCAADRRPGPRVFSGLQLPPVLLQRLRLVFLMLDHAWLPCQASITSQLFSAVYYTKVILEPGTRIPKTKLFLCMEVEKRLLAGSESPSLLWRGEIQSTAALLFPCFCSIFFILFPFFVFSSVVLTGIQWGETLTLSKQLSFWGENTL